MWPKVTYETCDWARDDSDLVCIPKSQRRKITQTYLSAVPPSIANVPVVIPSELASRIADVRAAVERFDQAQSSKGYNLPAFILRSESSSSSQIEQLTSSVRNVALAELSDKAPSNARLIADNIAAMRKALNQKSIITTAAICQIHDTLMAKTDSGLGLREEPVWIGGTPYSPHGALFVPPKASRVRSCLEDVCAFSERDNVPALVKAALFHAQFESIHPFTDGNGRIGRTLLHRVLAGDQVIRYATLPVSAGLLHDVKSYMAALSMYHEGEIEPIITCLINALDLAVVIGVRISSDVDEVLDRWGSVLVQRKGSASHRLAALLVEQPVVSVAYIAEKLEIVDRSARNLVEVACENGILSKMGNAKRGAFYQASDLIEILEEVSNVQGIRRIAAR